MTGDRARKTAAEHTRPRRGLSGLGRSRDRSDLARRSSRAWDTTHLSVCGQAAALAVQGADVSAAAAVVKMEREAKAATALVTHHEKISEGFLKQEGIKLSKAKRTYTKSVSRRESFAKGKVDSKDIDINQKSLAGPKDGAGGKRKAR